MAVGNVFEDAWDEAKDIATSIGDDIGDAIKKIPGSGPLGDALSSLAKGPLRDFAKTTIGHAVLIAIGTTFAGSIAWFGGPQLASVAFAIPGLAKGDDFETAWLQGVNERASRSMQATGGGDAGPGQASFDQLNTAVKGLADEYGPNVSIPETVAQIAKRYGIPEDIAAYAKSLVEHNGQLPDPAAFDPVTGKLLPNLASSSLSFALAHDGQSAKSILLQAQQQARVDAQIQSAIAAPSFRPTSALAIINGSATLAPVSTTSAQAPAASSWTTTETVAAVGAIVALAVGAFVLIQKR